MCLQIIKENKTISQVMLNEMQPQKQNEQNEQLSNKIEIYKRYCQYKRCSSNYTT